ncbi:MULTISPECIES: diaminopimelate decarboxylase [Acetobacter]|jgi:diaminopimelate decarboxylase|uniref:Diaminopimelate decarboxylase n=1 Tax=Acetobacter lovaniensis TaxID=104100 RepID=A0A841QCA6_9PROT|nr:diaminopimelate decarboxylase [Acetobacter lovaniensis]MBB6455873.1 diaminopimelate decarboxylase [Acetobacter lovaniensis]MCI1697195.1 diaminopimelate decarboxylase [Acetobacter lovaniensis]MCI1796181.1 diaminopimelate decarboxylase [Acetobacter lovaniensis]MCP1238294.1 diaminopimelate decarboxylase [Acetobacter lovaniensis]NHN80267.1 diaminopimelate decarboxylase [Acetobacter lovaniensis]
MADSPAYTDADPSLAELLATHPHLSTDPLCGLMFEGVPLNAIADAVGTPCWVLGAGTLRQRLARMHTAMADAGLDVSIHYAVKANDHLSVLSLIGQEGYGADIVSGGELARTQKAGIAAQRVVFSGVGKSDAELDYAIGLGIGQINVESAEELAIISAIATRLGKQATITLRINPDVDAKTHAKITTGLAANKFGIPFDNAAALYAHAFTLPGIKPVGFATHIGSQILSTAPYHAAYARVAELVRTVRASGLSVEAVDCGGGLGISYRNEVEGQPEALAGAIRAELGGLGLRLSIEPGRWPIGPAGVLLSSVILRKEEGLPSPFLVLDAAMNDMVRPSMYDAWHGLVPLAPQAFSQPVAPTHVVGPVCESGDTFARDRLLPPLGRASRIAILDTGAYGAVMSSTYNSRPLAAQVLVENGQWTVIRRRQTLEELWQDEAMSAPPNGKA